MFQGKMTSIVIISDAKLEWARTAEKVHLILFSSPSLFNSEEPPKASKIITDFCAGGTWIQVQPILP